MANTEQKWKLLFIFFTGGYYSSRSKHGLWQIGLNTILWYSYNSHVGNLSDPADQFQWLETELESIRQLEERVKYITGVTSVIKHNYPRLHL